MMSCPFLRPAQPPRCRAVQDGHPVTREVLATYCRGAHEGCPAFRYLRASGHPTHPADFRAWVVRSVSPGRTDPAQDAASGRTDCRAATSATQTDGCSPPAADHSPEGL